jgi:transposase
MLTVGIDWAQTHPHRFVILTGDGECVKQGTIQRSVDGACTLMEEIQELEEETDKVRVGIDRKGDLVSRVLSSEGYEVYPLNPKSTKRAREQYFPAGHKDDYRDAFVHANMVRNNCRHLQPLRGTQQLDRQIRDFLSLRESFVEMRSEHKQKLHSRLAKIAPGLERLCENLHLAWVRDLLQEFPLDQDLHEAHGNRINGFLDDHKMSSETEQKLRQIRRQTPPRYEEEMARGYRQQIRCLLEAIIFYDKKVEGLEEKIESLLQRHPDEYIFQSLPTRSQVTIAALCTVFGQDRDVSYDWRDFASYYGTTPITEKSGGYERVKKRQAYQDLIHDSLLNLAEAARRRPECWAHGYYNRKRREGKTHHHALRCLASRWVKILHAMWKNRTTYDENYHQRRRQEAGQMAA